jgi:hypothetical protein
MPGERKIELVDVRERIEKLSGKPEELKDYLEHTIPYLRGPNIDDFLPRKGYPGTILTIRGTNFASSREDNIVTVGGKPATVIEAVPGQLRVITSRETMTGPVDVMVGHRKARAKDKFRIIRYPAPGSSEDGPPIYFSGEGYGYSGDVPSTGTLNVLVVLVNPTDRVPANATNARNTVVQAWDNVHTFYNQASYARLDVDIDITASWHTLSGTFNDYVSTNAVDGDWVPNIRPGVLNRLYAETAQAAVDEGLTLNQYQVMACVINLDGVFICAWGGGSLSNFSYNNGAGININITPTHEINLIAIQESANWGRYAHELGHNIVSAPTALSGSPGAVTLGEDIYRSLLVDPDAATAAAFEIMGSHDSHPLFSAYYMERLGYYNSINILELQWNRNAFRNEYEVVAHGPAENTTGARYHLIKIRVSSGLYYYIEVRQQPDGTTQIFDDSIPVASAPQHGGVVVTKVLTDTMNMNQQMRFITLLHDPHVLKQGDSAIDPARSLKITVLNDHVVNRPLVCRVVIEWAQGIADDPNGAFDLWIEGWDGNWQTPDIWVDRMPYGTFDQPLDANSRPLLNGDKPRPNEINKLWGRIHCDGTVGATDVQVTFYTVEPPGVGDNGNWAPLQTRSTSIGANGHADVQVNWVPVVGRHTCLKVWASPQLGEISGGNNWAQENVFQFEAPAASVPSPVVTPVAVRNPLKERTIVYTGIKGVPNGYTVHFSHAWLWLEPLEERRLELVVVPTLDYEAYPKDIKRAKVVVSGYIPRSYRQEILPGILPGSRMFSIGGLTAEVTPKRSVDLKIWEDKEREKKNIIAVAGSVTPAAAAKLRIDISDPDDHLHVMEVLSEHDGRFHAVFDLPDANNPGEYRVQALIINSPMTAQAESNVLLITK